MEKGTINRATITLIRCDVQAALGRLKGASDVIGMLSRGNENVTPEKLQVFLQDTALELEKALTRLPER